MKILVADDQKEIRFFLKDMLEIHGYEVLSAANGIEALEQYREHRPSFTLTDITMPGLSGLELLRQIKALNPEAAVMLMTGAGTETYAIEALRGGAVNYFNKPIDIHELISTLSRYAPLAEGYDFEHYAGEFLVNESLHFELKNDISQANHAVQMIITHARAIFPLSEIFTLRFGLYEMIVNAIEHGNLGITYEEKSRALENNHLFELMDQRAGEPARAATKVRVGCDLSTEGLRCTIRDQGKGFNHAPYSTADDPAALFEQLGTSMHGRGIVLTRLQFDEVKFNDIGNEVIIIKHPSREGSKT